MDDLRAANAAHRHNKFRWITSSSLLIAHRTITSHTAYILLSSDSSPCCADDHARRTGELMDIVSAAVSLHLPSPRRVRAALEWFVDAIVMLSTLDLRVTILKAVRSSNHRYFVVETVQRCSMIFVGIHPTIP